MEDFYFKSLHDPRTIQSIHQHNVLSALHWVLPQNIIFHPKKKSIPSNNFRVKLPNLMYRMLGWRLRDEVFYTLYIKYNYLVIM